MIDVGGGNGQFLAYLGIRDATIFDISDSGLDFAKKVFGFNTIKGDIEKRFPFKDESFDVVYCCEVLEHLDNPEFVLQEIKRILRIGGDLVVSAPNVKPDGKHHKQWFKKEMLLGLIKNSGLKISWVYYSPKLNGNEPIDMTSMRGFLRTLISMAGSIILTYRLRYAIAKLGPNLFSSFFVLKVSKIR